MLLNCLHRRQPLRILSPGTFVHGIYAVRVVNITIYKVLKRYIFYTNTIAINKTKNYMYNGKGTLPKVI